MSTRTIRLTMAQALVRHLAALRVAHDDGTLVPYLGGVFAIFGHGNVAGIGEALQAEREAITTFRAHNEQAMAHAAIAFGKANFRRRIMAVTTSVGPGATNLVTAAALAHVNRLPLLLLPGDTFASRAPDPVLQQLEDFSAGDISANDCFRPVSRYFDRITRAEQILSALPRAIQVMTDPALCGPVCLALPQDVQTHAFDCPEAFLHPEPVRWRRPPAEPRELEAAAALLRAAKRPLIVAGGGVLFSEASAALAAFAQAHGVPVAETQAGKSSLAWNHALNLGAIGVTGSPAANAAAAEADLVLAVGSRISDFTTGSHSMFGRARLVGLNHKLWRAGQPGGYHMEYGYSCMGYEIAGGLGVKLARPQAEVVVMLGDGSYLMMNSEIATSVMLGKKLIIVVLDNRGYGCIHRLQRATGGARFNNLIDDCVPEEGNPVEIDFAMHARSLGAEAVHVASPAELKRAMAKARAATRTQVLVINTTAERTTEDGGCWWEVAVPEVSARSEVNAAHRRYLDAKEAQIPALGTPSTASGGGASGSAGGRGLG